MKRLLILAILSLSVCSSSSGQQKHNRSTSSKSLSHQQVNNNYTDQILATKQFYPFEHWKTRYDNGLTQYTEENCNKTQKAFDELINGLIKIGENASETQKTALFKAAILKTNQLNETIEGLIETEEREELCALINKITLACRLDPKKYGEGEGLAGEWREW